MDITDKYPDLRDADWVAAFPFETCWTVENPDKAMSEIDVAVALIQNDGNLTETAKRLGRSRRAVEGFVLRESLLATLAEDLEEEFLDVVEFGYRFMARSGDPQAARFFLSTKGKNRGYNQRSEVTGANGGPIQTETTESEANAFVDRLRKMMEKSEAKA